MNSLSRFVDDESDQKNLLGNQTHGSSEEEIKNASFYSIHYYRPFFDVSTKQVGGRLLRSLVPSKIAFYQEGGAKPDLYGPLWVASTLVLLMAVTGNMANYINFLPTETNVEWRYDFEKVTLAASMFYSMISSRLRLFAVVERMVLGRAFE